VRLAAPFRVNNNNKLLSIAPKPKIKITSYCFYDTLLRERQLSGAALKSQITLDLTTISQLKLQQDGRWPL
jgi:hypothetical protein